MVIIEQVSIVFRPTFDHYRELAFLIHFSPVFYFYTLWKRQKTWRFLKFSGGIEMKHEVKKG